MQVTVLAKTGLISLDRKYPTASGRLKINNEFLIREQSGKGHLRMGNEYWKLQASTHDKIVFITAGHFHHLCLLSCA